MIQIAGFARATDIGTKRSKNEDCSDVMRYRSVSAMVLCDGVGGGRRGDVAALVATNAFRGAVAGASPSALLQEITATAFTMAHNDILVCAEKFGAAGMATTMVTMAAIGSVAVIGNVGDSRCYRFRHGTLERITTDHSMVAELVSSGQITQEVADRHPQRNIITRAVGGRNPEPDIQQIVLLDQDIVLLSSDGFHGVLTDKEIQWMIAVGGDNLDWTAQQLVGAALVVGGDDNITVTLYRHDVFAEY